MLNIDAIYQPEDPGKSSNQCNSEGKPECCYRQSFNISTLQLK